MTEIVPLDDESVVGLEDMDDEPVAPQRLKIVHANKNFEIPDTGIATDAFTAVILGMVRQRVLWPPEIGNGPSKPMCRSRDGKTGYPDPESFPLKASGLQGLVLEQGVTAGCKGCSLKEWGSHPTQDKPWCTEQFVLPMLADLMGNGRVMPVFLTAERGSILAAKKYIVPFQQSRTPMFTVFTEISLQHDKRGSVQFSKPVFKRAKDTPPESHAEFAAAFLQMRDYLQAVRTEEDVTTGGGDNLDDLDDDF